MKVFCDMDGVLVNFRKAVHDAFNIPYDYPTLSPKWSFWKDWPEVTFEQVNACCSTIFWANLEWMHDGREIFGSVMDNFSDVYLLTTPMPNLGSASGKAIWVHKNAPIFEKRLIITRASKSLLAGPDTLLIDDRDKNVEEFRTAGGQACLVPRPWNKSHSMADRSVDIVKTFLEGLKT